MYGLILKELGYCLRGDGNPLVLFHCTDRMSKKCFLWLTTWTVKLSNRAGIPMKQFIVIKMLGVALFTLSHDVISGEMIICSSKSVWWLPPKSIQLSWRNVWRRRKKKKVHEGNNGECQHL